MCISHNGATSRASHSEWHSFLWCSPGYSISDLEKCISASWYMTIYESYTRSVESLYVECTVLAASDSSFCSAGIISFVKNLQARRQEMRVPHKSARFILEICKSGGNSSIYHLKGVLSKWEMFIKICNSERKLKHLSSKMFAFKLGNIHRDLQLRGETRAFVI